MNLPKVNAAPNHAGGIVASIPIRMVNSRKPPRKIVILAMGPPTL